MKIGKYIISLRIFKQQSTNDIVRKDFTDLLRKHESTILRQRLTSASVSYIFYPKGEKRTGRGQMIIHMKT